MSEKNKPLRKIITIIILSALVFCFLTLAAGQVKAILEHGPAPEAITVESFGEMKFAILSPKQIDFSSEIIQLTDDVGQDYFVNYRIKREQFREEIKEMLKPLLESDIRKNKEEAQKCWLELSKKIATEDELENVLIMRGYKDVVTEVNAETIKITLLAPELNYHDSNSIIRIVSDIAGFPQNRIEVTARE